MSPSSEMMQDPAMSSVGYTPDCTMPPEQAVPCRDAAAPAAAAGPLAARPSTSSMGTARDVQRRVSLVISKVPPWRGHALTAYPEVISLAERPALQPAGPSAG
jgi:hypothetical protein